MSSGDITRYVIEVDFQENSLTDINELNNHLTRAGFTLTLSDDEGNVHDLGTNTFGLISPQTPDQAEELAAGLAESALGEKPTVTVTTFDAWLETRRKEQQ